MKIYIGADHNGFTMKNELATFLRRSGWEVIDEGGKKLDPKDDFPQFAGRVVTSMKTSDDAEPRGILICGSGQGMVMAANRFKGIRASLVWGIEEARLSRNDDDANVLCLPGSLIDQRTAEVITHIWLKTPFAGATRFKRRLAELDEMG